MGGWLSWTGGGSPIHPISGTGTNQSEANGSWWAHGGKEKGTSHSVDQNEVLMVQKNVQNAGDNEQIKSIKIAMWEAEIAGPTRFDHTVIIYHVDRGHLVVPTWKN